MTTAAAVERAYSVSRLSYKYLLHIIIPLSGFQSREWKLIMVMFQLLFNVEEWAAIDKGDHTPVKHYWASDDKDAHHGRTNSPLQ